MSTFTKFIIQPLHQMQLQKGHALHVGGYRNYQENTYTTNANHNKGFNEVRKAQEDQDHSAWYNIDGAYIY